MSAKIIVASIFLSVILTSLIGIISLPILFPIVTEPEIPEDKDIILQSKDIQLSTQAFIYDDDTDFIKMADTEMNITVQSNSKIAVQFSAVALLSLYPDFNTKTTYEVSLVVDGVGNRTVKFVYFDNEFPLSSGNYRELSYNLYLNYITEPLTNGTYNAAMYWRSTWDATPDTESVFSVNHNGTNKYNYTRTLWVMEIGSL
jgi:hypothetical protein